MSTEDVTPVDDAKRQRADALPPDDRESPLYVEGVCCPHCHDTRSEEDKARYAERQKQVKLAEKRGKAHIGES